MDLSLRIYRSLRMASFLPMLLVMGACQKSTSAGKPATLVKTELVRFQTRQTVIALTGDIQARVRTELSFRVSGRVIERMVDVGAHVNAGDVLARLDPAEQQPDFAAATRSVRGPAP